MKKIFILSSLIAVTLATPSFAEPTELDKKTVASKAYVDTKQDKITTGNVMFWDAPEGTEGDMYVPGLVAYDPQTNALSGNKIGILDYETVYDNEGDLSVYNNRGGYGSEMDNFVPTVRAVAEALQNVWAAMPSSWSALSWVVNSDNGANRTNAINAYNTEFGNGTNNWAGNSGDLINGRFLANSLALKQNILPAQDNNLILGQQTGTGWASVLAPTTAGNVTQIGLWDAERLDGAYWNFENMYDNTTERTKIIKSIPTVGAVWAGLNRVMPAKYTGNLASTGGQTVELSRTAGQPSVRYITAGGSQPLTRKSGAHNVMLYINGTKTLAQYQTSNFGGTGDVATENQNYINGALVSLELLKDVYSALHNEIQNATPTGTPGNVAMYDPSTGALGNGVATYSGATAQNPYNATNDAAKIATAAAVETKQTKRVCAGYEPGHENDPDYCWLWDFPD